MSIRTRLTLWYTGLLAVFLLVFNVLVYIALQSALINEVENRLAGQILEVTNRIQDENDPLAVVVSGRVRLPSMDVFSSQYLIQITQLNGHVVQTSENLQGRSLPVPDDMIAILNAGLSDKRTIQVTPGVRMQMVSSPIKFAERPIGIIQIAQSLSGVDVALHSARRILLFGSLLLLALAALGGAVLARAALSPINAISETAHQITQTGDLDQRIPVMDPNDEIGQLTETFNDMLSRLEMLFQTQHRLVADVSHELRTPLTTIQGNLDLLKRGGIEDPQMRAEALRDIGDEVGRMRRLINDLLLLAQADSGMTLYKQPVEVDTLLLDVYRQAQVMAHGVGVNVRLGAEDQAMVTGDADRLRQLLLNLVDNAIKYTPAGGDVILTLRRDAGWVQLGVQDTGIGIAPEDLGHIFDRFYRADPSRARPGGSGLGLAIAQWIAQAHGGRIQVESLPGQGSRFTAWLPDASASPQALPDTLVE